MTTRRTGDRTFLAHAGADGEYASGLRSAASDMGWPLFPPLLVSPSWYSAARNAIATANAFVFVASASFRSSPYCMWELGYAGATDLAVIAIVLDDDVEWTVLEPDLVHADPERDLALTARRVSSYIVAHT